MRQTIHTQQYSTDSGESISVRVIPMLRIQVLQIEVNFNPYNHIQFASGRIQSIPGIKIMSGVCASRRNHGQFSFLLQKGADVDAIKKEVKTEFENYFVKF